MFSEEEFLRRLRAAFVVEAEEHLQAISAGLLELEQKPAGERKAEVVEEVFRHAHSLKGASRATNFPEIESVCQSMENVLAAWKRHGIDLPASGFDPLYQTVDLIGRLARRGDGPRSREDEQAVSTTLRRLAGLAPAGPAADGGAVPADLPVLAAAAPAAPAPAASRRQIVDTIRVSAGKLDRLLLEAEEMLAVKQSVAQRAADLAEVEALIEEWGRQWAQVQPDLREWRAAPETGGVAARVVEFLEWNFGCVKSLEGRIRGLGKAAAADRHETAKRVDDLLDDAKSLVMLPFSTLSDLFPKVVRDLGRDQGKRIELSLSGAEVEVDKRILDGMKDPLIHLLRNCVGHGVEKIARRLELRKPECARIVLTVAAVQGDKIEIVVADDGAGIDVAKVREAAVRRGVLSADDARALDDRRALELVFQSDVSTSPIITEISGRGLGLAIVRERTEQLGGRVSVESRPGEGTRFRILLPLTLATFHGVLVRAGGQVFVIPTAHVERVTRISPADIRTVENRAAIELGGRAVALVRLAEVLGLDRDAPAGEARPVVTLGSGDERIAFAVDEVLRDEEVLVKSFMRPLSRVRNIAGATVLASGDVAPILNAGDLMKSARRAGAGERAPAPAAAVPAAAKAKTILLAEDSITSRMLLKGILETAGYRVRTAVDGMEAWTALRTEDFDLVVSDVEMPRMNGFDLTAHIRADRKLADKPVVLVTALASSEDRERGIDVGASAYIVKSDFNQGSLLDVVRRLA